MTNSITFENQTFVITNPLSKEKVLLTEHSLASLAAECPKDKSEALKLGRSELINLLPALKTIYQDSNPAAEFTPQLISYISNEFKSTFTAVNKSAITNMLFEQEIDQVMDILVSWFKNCNCEISYMKVSGDDDLNSKNIYVFKVES